MADRAVNRTHQRPNPDVSYLKARKTAAIVSACVWTVGFFLAFVVPSGSTYLWLPDTLLLAGFVPLLLVWRPAWPWFVFALCNVVVGFVLEVARFLPDANLPGELPKVRQHLAELHVSLVWIFFGVGSLAYGTLRLMGRWWRRFCGRTSTD